MNKFNYKKNLFLVCISSFFALTLSMVAEDPIAEKLSLMDLPPEMHYQIVAAMMPEQLVDKADIVLNKHIENGKDIINVLKQVMSLLIANRYFNTLNNSDLAKILKKKIKLQIDNLDLKKIIDESYENAMALNQKRARLTRGVVLKTEQPKYTNQEDLKNDIVADVIQSAFEKAVSKNYPRIALILALTNTLNDVGLDGVTLVDRYIDKIIKGTEVNKENVKKFIQMLLKLQDQGFDIFSLFADSQQRSLFANLINNHISNLNAHEKKLIETIKSKN